MAVEPALSRRYGVPVVLENDVNAAAIGFARCYETEFPGEDPAETNMAYLHFDRGCVSAGFVAGGRVIRGCGHFAGELGLVPTADGRLLDECLNDRKTGGNTQPGCWRRRCGSAASSTHAILLWAARRCTGNALAGERRPECAAARPHVP